MCETYGVVDSSYLLLAQVARRLLAGAASAIAAISVLPVCPTPLPPFMSVRALITVPECNYI